MEITVILILNTLKRMNQKIVKAKIHLILPVIMEVAQEIIQQANIGFLLKVYILIKNSVVIEIISKIQYLYIL